MQSFTIKNNNEKKNGLADIINEEQSGFTPERNNANNICWILVKIHHK